jgi:YVTN family beta-propeller protein
MNLILRFPFGLALVFLLVIGCKDAPFNLAERDAAIRAIAPSRGIYVLNEGLFQRNNATLTYFNIADSVAATDFFEAKNGRRLGDTGNDLQLVGDKLYVLVNVSSKLEVLNAKTGTALQTIPIRDSLNRARQPRQMAFLGNYLFITCFDGTVSVLDTASLNLIRTIRVGRNPDGIATQRGKIYVANSGGLDFPNYDSTVSVINPVSLHVERTIHVPINPTAVAADRYGDVYVISQGNYDSTVQGYVPPRLVVIDAETDRIKKIFPFDVRAITISGSTAYLSLANRVMTLDIETETLLNTDFISASNFITLYGLTVDDANGAIYCTDARRYVVTGDVICFDRFGNRQFQFRGGLNPSRLAFLR